jgi:sporulation protein YlmC with PRC-barrel domain
MPAVEAGPDGLRASDLLGCEVYDHTGTPLGRVADLVVDGTRVVAVEVTKGIWGRLLGYERDSAHGPWPLEALARAVLRRNSRRVDWDQVTFEAPT